MAFQKSWRKYQARLLDHLEAFLTDQRIHIVAAPGSGKTILGLEIIRRLDQPTLVLVPTLTIRDQWVDRLREHFLPAGAARPSWVSTNLRNPAPLTVATYQALHSICSGAASDEEREDREETGAYSRSGSDTEEAEDQDSGVKLNLKVPEVLAQAGFKTLVADEAHHLRAEWWKTLRLITREMRPTIVALTGTPPYDVAPQEWSRYEELCGEVDAEVAVPELVLSGDLCAHQDYVYFSLPSETAQRALAEFRREVEAFVAGLKANREFTAALRTHSWFRTPEAHVDEILEQPEYLSSVVIFLRAIGEEIPPEVTRTLGLSTRRIPDLSLEWLEILLSHYLYDEEGHSADGENLCRSLRRKLMEIGAIECRRIKLREPAERQKMLTSSPTKLPSIRTILELESQALRDSLRCVVLTDFIRKAELPNGGDGNGEFEDIGIVPIFETLRRAKLTGVKLGILSGSLVIIPVTAERGLRRLATSAGLESGGLRCRPVGHDGNYLTVEWNGEDRQGIVQLVTRLFECGDVTTLVGTKALLGEGWDAPCINTLVLASFVGSYVLSNQMRGRSIRIDSRQPLKTANIWHLVCVEPGMFGPGEDYDLLVRRCSAFVGVGAATQTIENGTARLGFGQPPFSREQVESMNGDTWRRAADRSGLRRKWEEVLAAGVRKEIMSGVRAAKESLPRGFIFANTIQSLLVTAWFVFVTIFSEILRAAVRVPAARDALTKIGIFAAIAAAISLPWVVAAMWRLLRHGTPERSIQEIGRVVFESLQFEGSLDREIVGKPVFANRNADGSVYCWIAGGSGKDQAVFVRTMRELLDPIDNPRYLLGRSAFWRFFREDYFAVPDILARRKEFAEFFARRWRRVVGPIELIYTRTPEGRRRLVRARAHSLSAAFQKRSERVSCWK